jgi:hypothetical protein
MVQAYANEADEVVVIISKPTKSGRKLPNGREVTAEDSLKIWQILAGDMPNVRIEVSKEHASPINAAYEFVGEKGPLNPGDKVILGCSNKGGDCKRWIGAEKYIKPGVELLPITGVEPTMRAGGEPYSATDFRNALGGALDNRAELADFVGEENIDDVLSILGLSTSVNEMSGLSGGGLHATPSAKKNFVGFDTEKFNKDEKEKSRLKRKNESSVTVDEVMRLIMERGILR